MTKENYNITFEDAKTLGIYKYTQSHIIEALKDFKSIKEINIYNDPVVLELGNIEIGLIVSDTGEELIIGYFVCVKYDKGNNIIEWESYDWVEDEVIITDNLEKDMFNIMMKFAKENNLYWSRPNQY